MLTIFCPPSKDPIKLGWQPCPHSSNNLFIYCMQTLEEYVKAWSKCIFFISLSLHHFLHIAWYDLMLSQVMTMWLPFSLGHCSYGLTVKGGCEGVTPTFPQLVEWSQETSSLNRFKLWPSKVGYDSLSHALFAQSQKVNVNPESEWKSNRISCSLICRVSNWVSISAGEVVNPLSLHGRKIRR